MHPLNKWSLTVLLASVLVILTSGVGVPLPYLPSEGPRQVLIVHETSDTSPEHSLVFGGLRSGAHADYLKTKQHTLAILDDDSADETGQPSPLVAKWQPYGTLPEILIIDPPDTLLLRTPMPATADGVIELVKANGG